MLEKIMKNKKVYPPRLDSSRSGTNRRGITFVEAIINIYIYVLIISVTIMVAVTFIKTRSVIRQKQQAVEELSILMNEMGKKIRMSSCQTTGCGDSNDLYIDTNEGQAIHYELDASTNNLTINEDVMFDNVGGAFYVTRSGADQIPLITIKLWKLDKSETLINGTTIKTSVSMRSGYEAPTSP